MDEHLERIVAADEEARARVAAARAQAAARIDAAREQSRRQQAARIAAHRRRWTRRCSRSRALPIEAVSERKAARAHYAEARRKAAEPLLAEAADIYARIVRDGAPPRPTT